MSNSDTPVTGSMLSTTVLFGPCSCGARPSPTHILDEICWFCGAEKSHVTLEELDASLLPPHKRSEYEVFLIENAPTRQQLESNLASRMKRIWRYLLESPSAVMRLAQKFQTEVDPDSVRETLLQWQADGQPDPKRWLSHKASQEGFLLSYQGNEDSSRGFLDRCFSYSQDSDNFCPNETSVSTAAKSCESISSDNGG